MRVGSDRIPHFAHYPSAAECVRSRVDERSADHLVLASAIRKQARTMGLMHSEVEFDGDLRNGKACRSFAVRFPDEAKAVVVAMQGADASELVDRWNEPQRDPFALTWLLGPGVSSSTVISGVSDRVLRWLIVDRGHNPVVRVGREIPGDRPRWTSLTDATFTSSTGEPLIGLGKADDEISYAWMQSAEDSAPGAHYVEPVLSDLHSRLLQQLKPYGITVREGRARALRNARSHEFDFTLISPAGTHRFIGPPAPTAKQARSRCAEVLLGISEATSYESQWRFTPAESDAAGFLLKSQLYTLAPARSVSRVLIERQVLGSHFLAVGDIDEFGAWATQAERLLPEVQPDVVQVLKRYYEHVVRESGTTPSGALHRQLSKVARSASAGLVRDSAFDILSAADTVMSIRRSAYSIEVVLPNQLRQWAYESAKRSLRSVRINQPGEPEIEIKTVGFSPLSVVEPLLPLLVDEFPEVCVEISEELLIVRIEHHSIRTLRKAGESVFLHCPTEVAAELHAAVRALRAAASSADTPAISSAGHTLNRLLSLR